jgi:hypothetical protein
MRLNVNEIKKPHYVLKNGMIDNRQRINLAHACYHLELKLSFHLVYKRLSNRSCFTALEISVFNRTFSVFNSSANY